jgi:hypothetical protein
MYSRLRVDWMMLSVAWAEVNPVIGLEVNPGRPYRWSISPYSLKEMVVREREPYQANCTGDVDRQETHSYGFQIQCRSPPGIDLGLNRQ